MAKTAMKRAGSAVLGLAVLVGSVGRFRPHWFMALPFPASIVLWIMTGHDMPPYIMKDPWHEDEVDTWTKDGDLVVTVGAKSGTHWMLYCAHQIRTKGSDADDALFPNPSAATPWPDMRQSRGGTWAEQKGRLNTTALPDGRLLRDVWDHPSYPFRIWKSHFFPPLLPVRREGGKRLKYLAMARNGIDVAASMATFYTDHTDRFRNLFGGFPPKISAEDMRGDSPPAAVKDLLPGGPIGHFYFGYVKQWWPYRSDPNVLLLHYTDVRRDLRRHVKRIADFLGVGLTRRQLGRVTERCGIEHMRGMRGKLEVTLPLNTDGPGLWDPERDVVVEPGSIANRGGIGTGESKFSDKVVAQWRKAEEEQFGHDPVMLRWAREGGGYPPAE